MDLVHTVNKDNSEFRNFSLTFWVFSMRTHGGTFVVNMGGTTCCEIKIVAGSIDAEVTFYIYRLPILFPDVF